MNGRFGEHKSFGPAYDLSFRFKTPKLFDVRRVLRPHTSDGVTSSSQYAFKEQESRNDAFRRSLGGSLMILGQLRTDVHTHTFTNLEKMYTHTLKEQMGARVDSRKLPYRSQPQRRTDDNFCGMRVAYSQSLARNSTIPEGNSPSTLRKAVADFISNTEYQKVCRCKVRENHSDEFLSGRRYGDDRCRRCASYPEIQIDGRYVGNENYDGSMAHQYCDVLGKTMCPDCIRLRARNDHFKTCNIMATEKPTDVYKTALAKKMIPSMGDKEKPKLVGDIIDRVVNHNTIQAPNEIKSTCCHKSVTLEKHVTSISIETSDMPAVKSRKARRAANISLRQTDQAVEDIRWKKCDSNRKSGCDKVTENIKAGQLTSGGDQKSNDLKTGDARQLEGSNQKKKSANDGYQTSRAPEHPDRNLKVFNRDIIPSTNYFTDVSDLMQRIKRCRSMRKNNFFQIEPLLGTVQQGDDNIMPVEAKSETGEDNASSHSSQISLSPRNQKSSKKFEPPVLYGWRPRYIGLAHSSAVK